MEYSRTAGLSRFLGEVYRGLDRGEFFVAFQPVVDAARGRLDSLEALVRWQHPVHGLLGPDAFVPRLEGAGHLRALTGSVLRDACASAAAWPVRAGWAPRVRVNVAPAELSDILLVHDVGRTLTETGLDPGRLVLEVTEGGPLRDVETTQTVCRQLRAAGSAVALDDFGSGESDLARLVLLDVDELKIDRTMVAGLPGDGAALGSVLQILDLAATMNLQVTVEGVETPAQLRTLMTADASLLQGYLFGRPSRLLGAAGVRTLEQRCRAMFQDIPVAAALRPA